MSAFGTKRTFVCAAVMSAFGGKADIASCPLCSVRGPAVLGERLDQANGMKVINPPEVIDHQA
jgi:hypothetical protein